MNHWRVGIAALGAAVLAIAMVLVGDGATEPSLDQRFAESLCATSIPHVNEMLEVYDDVVHTRATPGKQGWVVLYSPAYRAREIAGEYRREIRQVPSPDTAAGRRAERYRDFHSRDPLSVMSDVVRRIGSTPRNMTLVQNIRGLNRLQLDLVTAISSMGGGVLPVPNVVPGLADEFESADSCKELDKLRARDRT